MRLVLWRLRGAAGTAALHDSDHTGTRRGRDGRATRQRLQRCATATGTATATGAATGTGTGTGAATGLDPRRPAPDTRRIMANHSTTRALTLALTVVIAASAVVEAGCTHFPFDRTGGQQTASPGRRVGAPPRVRYPSDVEPPQRVVVAYPPDATRVRAVQDFLLRASERGATWVSKLSVAVAGPRPCEAPLLPESVRKEYDATYLTEDQRGWGQTEYHVQTRTEAVSVPFLRVLDDLDSILKDIDIWTSKQRETCAVPNDAPFEISADLHGRVGIGMRMGEPRIDLTRCGDTADAVPPDPADTTTLLLLGTLGAVDLADHILPGWVKARVMLELPDKQVQGVLTRYVNGTMSVQGDDGAWTYAHVLEAKGIVLLEPPGGALAVPRKPDEREPPATASRRDPCDTWRPERSESKTL